MARTKRKKAKKTTAAAKTPLGKRVTLLRKKLTQKGYKTLGTNYTSGSITMRGPEGEPDKVTLSKWIREAVKTAKDLGFTVVRSGIKTLKLNEPKLVEVPTPPTPTTQQPLVKRRK